MKFRFFLFILLGVANALASDLDFTLVNQTGRSFEGVYITDSNNKDWDANILLDGKVLAAGGKISVRFKNDANSETWDFNLVDDEGLSVTFDKVKLAGVDTVTLKDVDGKITAEIEYRVSGPANEKRSSDLRPARSGQMQRRRARTPRKEYSLLFS